MSLERSALRRTPSIAFRVGAAMTLILTLAAIVTVLAASRFGRSAADEAFDRLLKGAALQIAERVVVTDGAPVVDLPVSAFELLSLARNDRVFYRIIGPDGTTLTGYDKLPLPDQPAGSGEQIYQTRFKGVPIRAVLLTRQLAEEALSGKLRVVVAQTTEERGALAQVITTRAVALIVVTGAALLILALVVLRFALRPLARLETLILSRDSGDLSPLDVEVPREVGALVTAINRFMGRLDRRIGSMQDFVADAAHQMRTPITALRAQSQLALGETDRTRLKRLHQRIHTRAVGLSRLADQLLSRALVSHRADAAPQEALDLRRVAIEAERELRVLSADEQDEIGLDLPEEGVVVMGDAFSLKEAVKNLLNNAVRHGTPPISVFVETSGQDRCRIGVRDAGPGIPAELRAHLGERFTKAGVTADSAGLGLAIVDAVANAHAGAVVAENPPEGGFVVALDLPLPRGGQA